MKQIYNKETKVADLIDDNATPPEGWTDQAPRWTLHEAWDYESDCWGESEELRVKAEKDKRISEIKSELVSLDIKSIRPIRDKEDSVVADINNKIKVLREELRKLL